jgi:hypothetical protein
MNLLGHPDGASPRWGSCAFRLKQAVSLRCTFASGDSHSEPEHVATIEAIEPVLGGILAVAEHRGELRSWIERLIAVAERSNVEALPLGGQIGDYVEAHIHDDCDLSIDVDALLCDPSFRGTRTEDQMQAIAEKHRLELVWHAGFRLPAASVPTWEEGRGIFDLGRLPDWENRWDLVALAARLDADILDAVVLGRAFASLRREPARWRDLGLDLALRQLKLLWLVVVVCGKSPR